MGEVSVSESMPGVPEVVGHLLCVCFKMFRMYAMYSKNGHALNSVTGDTVEDPLKDPSDQAHCDPRPCLYLRLHYASNA